MAGKAPTTEQQRALDRLVTEGRLDTDQAQTVRAALWGAGTGAAGASPVALVLEVAGYVGAGFIVGGICLLLGASWRDLGRTRFTELLAGIALALIVAGVLAAGGPHRLSALRSAASSVRRRLTGVLFAVSVAPAAFAASVATDERAFLKGSAVGLVVAVIGYAVLPNVVGLLTTGALSLLVTFALIDLAAPVQVLARSFALIAVGLLWTALAMLDLTPPRRIGLAIGAASTILGSQLALGLHTNLLAYTLTLAAGAGCFALYWWERATVLLVAGVIATTLALPEAVADWTNGQLSGPAILLTAGGALVGAGALGAGLRATRSPAATPTPTSPPPD
jgi:hypothetical protein